MSKFLFHPLAWSIFIIQCSTHAVASEKQLSVEETTERLPTITVTAEKQDERYTSSQAITQFNHDLLDVPFTKSHVSEKDIQNYNVQRISDALSFGNGVVYQDSYGGGFWDNY
jgi:iron complex outermembrane receptor protein